jgi:hypothetical protein
MTTSPEPDEDDFEVMLTENARVGVTLGTQFTYRGSSHWPKVKIEDSPFIVPVEQTDDDSEPSFQYEDGESVLYRVTEIAHRTLAATVARMKRDIDERYQADMANRTHNPTS